MGGRTWNESAPPSLQRQPEHPPRGLDSRAGFARSLLLPGVFSIAWGAAFEHSNAHGIRFLGPELGAGVKALARGNEGMAQQVAFNGGVAASLNEVIELSMQFSRAMNAPRESDRGRVVDALGGPGLWATYLSTSVEFHSWSDHFSFLGGFAAYLGDSRFHVAPSGRKVFSLGVTTEFERRSRFPSERELE